MKKNCETALRVSPVLTDDPGNKDKEVDTEEEVRVPPVVIPSTVLTRTERSKETSEEGAKRATHA